jgi:dephospho-CoA kinase
MLLVGLTGSIGMGKSETAKMFTRLGIPVYDADAAVHALYAKDGAGVGPVSAAFPTAFKDGGIDRAALSAAVIGKPEAMKRLEAIVHPLVKQAQQDWLTARAVEGAAMVVLDIPLLLDSGGPRRVDVVVVVSAPEAMQRARVLERPGMTPEKLDAILAKQLPDAEKRKQADFIIDTGRGLDHAFGEVEAVVKALKGRAGHVWHG